MSERKRKFRDIVKSAEATLHRYNKLHGAITNAQNKSTNGSSQTTSSLDNETSDKIPGIVNKILRDAYCIGDMDETGELQVPSHTLTSLEINDLVDGVLPFLDAYSNKGNSSEAYKSYSFKWAVLRLKDILDYVNSKKITSLLDIEALLASSGDTTCYQLQMGIQKELYYCIDELLRRLNSHLCVQGCDVDDDWALSFQLLKQRLLSIQASSVTTFQNEAYDEMKVSKQLSDNLSLEEAYAHIENVDKSKENIENMLDSIADNFPFAKQLSCFLRKIK